MAFIGKRITNLAEVPLLQDTDCLVVDAGGVEANKVTVATTRNAVISSSLVAGSTVQIQTAITDGKNALVTALGSQGVPATVDNTFSELESKVADLNVYAGSDKKEIPHIYGYSDAVPSTMVAEDLALYNSQSNLSYKVQGNGVVSIGEWKENTSGQVVYNNLVTYTAGTWTSVETRYANGTSCITPDGGIVFVADMNTPSAATGYIWDFWKVNYDKATHVVTATKYHFIYPSRGNYDEQHVYAADDKNRVWAIWRSRIVVFDLNTLTYTAGDETSYNAYAHPCPYVKDDSLVVVNLAHYTASATTNYIDVFKHQGTTVSKVYKLVIADDIARDVCVWDKADDCLVLLSDFVKEARVFNMTTYALTTPTISYHPYFRNTNVVTADSASTIRPYPYEIRKDQGSSRTLPDGRFLVCPHTPLYAVCIYDAAKNTITVPYITGFGVNDVAAIKSADWYGYTAFQSLCILNATTLSGTAYIELTSNQVGTIYGARNIKILLDEKNEIDYKGNVYALED